MANNNNNNRLRFDGKVVIVTGAGAGIGRTYAHEFASRGAKIVVNDLGGGRHGDGSSANAADNVVAEIKAKGGNAVADYNSVIEGEKIVKTAMDNFGRVDILINNAGILRDKSFAKISDLDWDLVHKVHLKGSFKTTQAAFPIMKKQGFGRIVMTASNSGLYGNFGQANYSAAKMALVGLAKTVAIEGAKSNVFCNIIVPTAASRLTEDILPPDIYNELKPEFIAPVVAYLCHDVCQENGAIIEAAAGWAAKCSIVRSHGAILRESINDSVSMEKVQKKWDKITDLSTTVSMGSIQEATGSLIESLENLKNPENNRQDSFTTNTFEFSDKDAILYALSVGASLADPNELKFLYESHENFDILPTFFILPSLQLILNSNITSAALPWADLSFEQFLHGEQYLEIVGQLPRDGKLIQKAEVAEVLDKGTGAVVAININSYDKNNNLVVRNQIVTFAVGAGKFGGPRSGSKTVPSLNKPNRNPDLSLTCKTSIDQAALYRLTGDTNPLHIDPNVSLMAGYKTPILHGLCSLGISVRLVLKAFAGHEPALFKSVKVRFSKPVNPGDTLRVDMWRDENRIYFETTAIQAQQVVINGAYVDLKSVKMPSIISNNEISENKNNNGLKSDAIFEYIIERVKADPNQAKKIGGIFLYKITKDGKEAAQWTMDLKNAKVYGGTPESKPNTTIIVSDEDFLLMAEGKLQPQQAFMKGKLKITGNIMMAQKLTPLLKANAKL